MLKRTLILIGITCFITSCNSTKVPNVVGQEASYARGILKGKGFEVEAVDKVEDDVKAGQVLNQEPSAETSIKKGSKIKLIIAQTPVYEIKGSLKLIDSKIEDLGSGCYGTGGYEDIRAGMPVTIKDGKGTILATGITENGKRPIDEFSQVQCVFSFQIGNVPKSEFYSIEVGHRGQLNYSYQEIKKRNWEVNLSLS